MAQQKPNIVLFFVDDMGWADLGFRNPVFETPNIDKLKKEGMSFERAYISTPTCSPSRASLLTGKEPVRFQMVRHIPEGKAYNFDENGRTQEEFHLWEKDPVQMPSRNWLPLSEITYAERLKQYGYYNMFIGKWHLGSEAYHPIKQGFDAQIGASNFGHPKSYYQPFFKQNNPLADSSDGSYLTDVLTEKTQDFIADYKESKPFMLTLWYYTVHGPHIGRKDLVEKFKARGLEGKYAEYAAMVAAMDESIGKIRQSLVDKGIADNTVILFLSDQGGYFTNSPLSGGKTGGNTLGEGGARVPLLMYYPGVTKPNSETSVPVQSIDLYPTLIEIASGKKCEDKQINGVSLMPLVKGKKLKSRNLYFFRSYEDQYAAVISGDWKLVKYHSGRYDLFNIAKDISEKNNLYGTNQKEESKLKSELANWEKSVVVQ
ncbi:sulfatase [Dyadobacter jejuensis]|nr:sulfatase [Dyadobacter jejuensis]